MSNICKFKAELFIGSSFAKLKSLWRDFVSPKRTLAIYLLLQLLQYLSGPTSHFAYCCGCNIISRHHANNLPCFAGGFSHMPGGVFLEVFATCIQIFRHVFHLLFLGNCNGTLYMPVDFL